MKIFLSLKLLAFFVGCANGVTYLRPKNDRGPGATRAGVNCIEQVERYFFKNKFSEQVQNIAVFHSRNLSSPAMEIEFEYLFGLHDRIMNTEEGEDSFQLKVISDRASKQMFSELSFIDTSLTDFYVVVVDNLAAFNRNIKSISFSATFNEDAKFLIIFNNPLQRDGGKLFSLAVLGTLFTRYRAVNVVVLFASDAFAYDIYSGDPYHGTESECGKMKSHNIGRCVNGKLNDRKQTKKQLQVDKVPAEMRQCTFTVCARVQEPFVNEGCHDGLEIHIIYFLQEVMGFGINMMCSEMDRGEPKENGTWSDLLGKVRDDSCDIMVGALFPDHEVHADFAATEFYLEDFYSFYVQKAPLAPRWLGLITIFKIRAWTACGVVLIVSWIFWWLMALISHEKHQHRQIILTFINVLAVTLGVSANNRPLYSPLRMFFSFLAIYALTITAIYTSKLIIVFTHPKYDYQVDSIEELLEMDLPIGGRLENMDWFDNGDEIDKMVFDRYNHTEPFRPSTKTLKRIKNGEITLLVSRLYVRNNKYQNDVFGLSRSMFATHLEMIVERGFPLLRRINNIISALRDMGLMSKLLKDFTYNTTILAQIRQLKSHLAKHNVEAIQDLSFTDEDEVEESPETVLTTEHLEGAFTLLLLGLFVSSTVFILEVIFRSRFVRKYSKILWMKIRGEKAKKVEKSRRKVTFKEKTLNVR